MNEGSIMKNKKTMANMACFLIIFSLITMLRCSSSIDNVISKNHRNKKDYKDALAKAILFFEGQRSGKLPASQRVKWRADSALTDGEIDNVKLVGGYYDAGDNVKFTWPMSYSMTLLSWAAIEYEKPISSSNNMEQLQHAIRWGADFILRAHTSPTTFYAQVGDANSDHGCWERPEDMDTNRTLYKLNPSTPGTEVAGDAAAALASASMVFKHLDPVYSSKLLAGSKSLFQFANKNRGSFQGSCPFYCSYSGYQDELLWAAAWLYKATGEETYLNFVITNKHFSQKANEFSWDNKFAGVQMLLTKEYLLGKKNLLKFKEDADSFVCSLMQGSNSRQIKTTPGGLIFVRDGSNMQYVTSASMLLSFYANTLVSANARGVQCGSTNLAPSKIKDFAASQVNYILGENPMKMSYMVGFGSKFPQHLHHRSSSIPSIHNQPSKVGCKDGMSAWFNSAKPNPNIHVGAIVGGPGSSDQFSDSRSNYQQLEPSTYINAAFVGSIAALM